MLGAGRVLAEGVIPRIISLPVTPKGVNDQALQALESLGQIIYIEREFVHLANHKDMLGMYLIYLEIKQEIKPNILQQVSTPKTTPNTEFEQRWEKHIQKEGRIPLSGEAYARAQRLRQWRKTTAKALNYINYMVMNNQQLDEIAARNPKTLSDFKAIKGFGQSRIRRYGEAIINVLQAHKDELTARPVSKHNNDQNKAANYQPVHTVERVSYG